MCIFSNFEITSFRGKTQAAKDIAGRSPMTHYWDAHDPKLIVCEAKIMIDAFNKKEKEEKKSVSLSKTMDDGPVSLYVCLKQWTTDL
jgi:intraflagellar transport protein 140